MKIWDEVYRRGVTFMAKERKVPLIVWAVLGFGTIAVEVAALSLPYNDNWTYVGIYVGIFIYTLFARALLPALTTLSLVALRSVVAMGWTGYWLHVTSVIFASLYLLLIVENTANRRLIAHGDREKTKTQV